MARKKSYLLNQCKELGITASEKETAAELMDKLRDVICKDRDLLPQIDVMLCKNAKDFMDFTLDKPWDTPKMHEMFWDNESYWAEPKLDGVRSKLHITENGGRTDSRRISDVDYAYTENSENFPHIRNLVVPGLHGTILDGEMLSPVEYIKFGGVESFGTLNCTTRMTNSDPDWSKGIQAFSGPIHFVAFDVLMIAGEDIRHLPLWKRRQMLDRLIKEMHAMEPDTQRWLRATEIYKVDKLQCFEECLGLGNEGVVLKDKYGTYECGKRPNTQWKLKKFIDLSGFISGYEPGKGNFEGLVGPVKISAFDENGDQIEFGAFSAFSMELRKAMTTSDGSLNPEYLGKVVDVRAQETTKNNRMRHCVLIRFRDDLTANDCHIKFSEGEAEQD